MKNKPKVIKETGRVVAKSHLKHAAKVLGECAGHIRKLANGGNSLEGVGLSELAHKTEMLSQHFDLLSN